MGPGQFKADRKRVDIRLKSLLVYFAFLACASVASAQGAPDINAVAQAQVNGQTLAPSATDGAQKFQALMLDSTGQWTIRGQVNEGTVMFMAKYGHFVEPILWSVLQ